VIMHSCDNPSCVNPRHLSLGTYKDNIWDCCKKDRRTKGLCKRSIIDPEIVYQIRHAIDNKIETMSSLAKKFNISPTAVSNAALRKSWAYLPER